MAQQQQQKAPGDITSDAKRGERRHVSRLDQIKADHNVLTNNQPAKTLQPARLGARSTSLTDVASLASPDQPRQIATSQDTIVRPKSASDFLGLHRDITPHPVDNGISSQTRVKYASMSRHNSGPPSTHHSKKAPPTFTLPPVPRPALLRGPAAPESVAPADQAAQPVPLLSRGIEISPPDTNKSSERASSVQKDGCWWLDVSCPGWEDLRDLGELLHLHPLTLEDVLQQDPREKLDLFENLGYYLIVFRAIDESYFKYTAPEAVEPSTKKKGLLSRKNQNETDREKAVSGKGTVEIVETNPGKEGLEGVGVGAINVYLVVFADGIVSVSSSLLTFNRVQVFGLSTLTCQFHYGDISKHIDRVRDKLSALDRQSINAGKSSLFFNPPVLHEV